MLPAFMPSVVAFELDDPAPIYELLAERCRHVRVALEVMTGCE